MSLEQALKDGLSQFLFEPITNELIRDFKIAYADVMREHIINHMVVTITDNNGLELRIPSVTVFVGDII